MSKVWWIFGRLMFCQWQSGLSVLLGVTDIIGWQLFQLTLRIGARFICLAPMLARFLGAPKYENRLFSIH
ncbi:hypothetical protein [Erythrobacter rubeus]|uniref:Uncharacterized protein n=1 Tax=Erythrobacter rubeus TaxID=2760803 RepID=A0ABR8KT84_9SPHN|nr:hypothetical protein [Erythrobacter rubeus]MBD2841467.1 hypothetical protein [Erythrobacter rubeus]